MKHNVKWIGLLFTVTILIVGCKPGTPPPTYTPLPTYTPPPTWTPLPTHTPTPTPTNTPAPTSTPTNTPTPTSTPTQTPTPTPEVPGVGSTVEHQNVDGLKLYVTGVENAGSSLKGFGPPKMLTIQGEERLFRLEHTIEAAAGSKLVLAWFEMENTGSKGIAITFARDKIPAQLEDGSTIYWKCFGYLNQKGNHLFMMDDETTFKDEVKMESVAGSGKLKFYFMFEISTDSQLAQIEIPGFGEIELGEK